MSAAETENLQSKIAGCWLGKNIGGTLGAPFEGTRECLDLTFYTQPLRGEPEPNDDLDLQLLWLEMAERYGVEHLTPRLFGEFWLDSIIAGWNEYGVACANMQNGFFPPLSGTLNNRKWGSSNGAWIRSELWACLFPGKPEEAATYAWMDASADHCGDGIFAELFTAALESMAFVENDRRKLIENALGFIPEECAVARAVRHCCTLYDDGRSQLEARDAIVVSNADTGFFQAPQNIAFVILGLLYGEGEFDKTLLSAVNCGDDTDCTGATVGAIMGILLGEEGIPERWKSPIGRGIRTTSIDNMHNNIAVPKTLDELTARVMALSRRSQWTTTGMNLSFLPVSPEYRREVLECDTQWMTLPLGSGFLIVYYPEGAEIAPGGTLRLKIASNNRNICRMDLCTIRIHPPEGWRLLPADEVILRRSPGEVSIEVQAPERMENAISQLLLEVHTRGRNYPEYAVCPIQTRGAVQPLMEGRYHLAGQLRRRKERYKAIGEAMEK